ncbi:histone-lysine N-methyltransferase SMYD3 [Garra rufa]|uniref:histone-lysine N-methyltransferase SMYD3 n=1 Tax=Garra rufa TaxID=137080 RepID=UPI003CCEF385
MAGNIERFVSEGKGNGLRALREIKAGEEIYSCEPYAFCIAKDFLKTACQSCLKRGESLSRCSQCKTARYCSVQCQKQAWPDHKRECKCLKRLQPRIPTDSVRLAARIIFKLLSQSESDQEELYSIAEHQSRRFPDSRLTRAPYLRLALSELKQSDSDRHCVDPGAGENKNVSD